MFNADMNENPDTVARLRLLLTGLAAGDSLGSTSEFVPQGQIPALYEGWRRRGWPLRQVGGGSFAWEPGAPTDDTQMAWAMVESFLENGCRFDPADVAARFVRWMESGPPDIGETTSRALTNVQQGTRWDEGGRALYEWQPRRAANGSLMRNGVVPAMADDLPGAFELTLKHGIITHYGPLPVLCCGMQTWLIRLALDGRCPCGRGAWLEDFRAAWDGWLAGCGDPAVRRWREAVRRPGPGGYDDAWDTLQQASFAPEQINPFEMTITGRDGYCVLTLQIAVWAAAVSETDRPLPTPPGFPDEPFDVPPGEQAAHRALAWVALVGHDSDTYGAVAGPILAAMHGEPPEGMTDGLLAPQWLDRLLEQR